VRSLLLSAAVAAVAAVAAAPTLFFRDATSGMTFRYPRTWHVSGFSGAGTQFRPRPRRFAFAQFRFANYECFGPSYLVRFRVDGHNLQVNVAVGAAASSVVRAEALAILDSIR